ncbi:MULTISPECIES: hypothetical protein [Bacteroides]|uniref:hypothetical protein n=1 Tax=Bacteroides TaxID=816 RepID=UPI0025A5185E|nr:MULTISPECIES: hypothetical protein [Bacteroides]
MNLLKARGQDCPYPRAVGITCLGDTVAGRDIYGRDVDSVVGITVITRLPYRLNHSVC